MTFNVWTFLFEIINFVVLAYLLHRLLYRPLRQAIDQRREANARAQAEAEEAHRDAVAMQKELQSQLTEIEHRRQHAIQETRELVEAERLKLLAEAERVVRRRQEEAREMIEQQREAALHALRAEVASMSVELAERLLSEAADSTLQRQLAKRLVESLSSLPDNERRPLRDDWKLGDGAVLEAAAVVDDVSLRQITDALGAVLGEKVQVRVETKPALLAGVRLRVGSHVWDASVAGQLEKTRPDQREAQGHV